MKIKNVVKITLCVSIVIFIFTSFKKDELPAKASILKQLYQEPKQTDTSAAPFTVSAKGINYSIIPHYDYELYGLVVSYHHSKVFWDYEHENAKDFVNTADICVMWGKNIETEIYKRMKFASGSFTCYTEFAPGVTQEIFSKYCSSCLSNNHLLSRDDAINREIMRVQKGDQIYIKGYLVNYAQKGLETFLRASSRTRTDNLCEVVFVKEFKILKRTNYLWRIIYNVTKYLVLACILFFVAKFCRYALSDN